MQTECDTATGATTPARLPSGYLTSVGSLASHHAAERGNSIGDKQVSDPQQG